MKKSFFVFLLLLSSICSFCAETLVGDLYYNFDNENKTAEVTKWRLYSGTLTIPNTVTYNSIEYTVTSIGKRAFAGSHMNEVIFPNTIQTIRYEAFAWCQNITSITFPESITTLEGGAFYNCIGLTSVFIHKNITSIGEYAFSTCYGLEYLEVDEDNPVYDSRDNCNAIIETATNTLLFGSQYTTTPETIQHIAGMAYNINGTAKIITIPKNILSIGNLAWGDNKKTERIYCYCETPCEMGNEVFRDINKIIPVYVPAKSIALYQSANVWSQFLNFQPLSDEIDSCPIDSGFCGAQGDNLKWKVTCDSVLTIFGSGEMADYEGARNYSEDDAPWYLYHTYITSVVIEEGVTSIGRAAFEGDTLIRQISLPNTLQTINSRAFVWCKELQSIDIPESVTSLGDNLFGACMALKTITLPPNITEIKEYTFNGCPINSIHIPEGVTKIGDFAFAWCDNLEDIQLPTTLLSMGSAILVDARSLRHIAIPEGITRIENETFVGCSNLTSIQLPQYLTYIGSRVFENCNSLQEITIPSKVETIGYGAFAECSGLRKLTCEAVTPPVLTTTDYEFDNPVFRNVDVYNCELHVPEESVGLYHEAEQWKEFRNIFDLEGNPGAILPANGTCGKQGDNLLWSIDADGVLTITGTGEMVNLEDIYYQGVWMDYKKVITSVVIESGATNVGNYAFDNCPRLTSISLSNTITRLGSYSFSYNQGITSVQLPKSLTYTGDYAFSGDSALQNIFLPDDVDTIGEGCFMGCASLAEITLPNNLKTIKFSAFNGSGITSIDIPHSVDSIGDFAFCRCDKLTELYLPSSVTKLGACPCWGCEKLANITVDEANPKYKSIDGILFNKNITKLIEYLPIREGKYEIPQTVTSLGERAFGNCTKLTEISIPENVTTMGTYVFQNCQGLSSISLPLQLKEIPNGAFYNCNNLQSVDIRSNITRIGNSAFSDCSALLTIDIPSTVTSIGVFAFAYHMGLTSIICRALTPPALDTYVFGTVDESIPLYVPAESMDLYRTAKQWKDFTNILSLEDIPQSVEPITDYTVNYMDKNAELIDSEIITLHLPEPPVFVGFTFHKWSVVAGDLKDGITIQAVYTADSPTSAPEIYTNPANSAQKLIRNGNVYILTDDKTYTVTGQEVK